MLLAGCGRLLSVAIVGLPDPPALWLGYLAPEAMIAAQRVATRTIARAGS